MNLYLITAHRWGDPELHSYTIGLTTNLILAQLIGKSHYFYRGGKYEAQITTFNLKLQSQYYLMEQYNEDRKNLQVLLFESREAIEMGGIPKTRKNTKVSPISPIEKLAEEDMLDLHQYIGSSLFKEEELEFLRSEYEKYIRQKYL